VAAAEAQSATLPEDLAAAHQLIGKLRTDLERSTHEIKWLRHRLDVLSRRLFGKRAEQLTPGQLVLAYEQLENETGKADEPVETDSGEGPPVEKTRPRRGRRAIPKDLRRIEVVVDLPDSEKTCATCGVERERIGEDVSQKYDYIPAELVCRVTRRLKYGGCRCHPGVLTAPAERAGGRGAPGPHRHLEVRRPPAALPAREDLRPSRRRHLPQDPR